jgi:molybdopterin biosynthesis enzyme
VIQARLGACLRPDPDRDEIFRVRLEQSADEVVAWPLPAKSGLITVMTRAQGMVYAKAGQPVLQSGELVDVQVLVARVGGNWRGVAE